MGSHTVGHTIFIVIDPVIQITAVALFLALPGVFLVVYGWMLIANRPRRLPWMGNRLRFAYQLADWYDKGTFQTEAQFEEIRLQLRSLAGWAIVGGGLGWLLFASGFVASAIFLTTEQRRALMTVPMGLPIIAAQGVSLGLTVGYLIGSAIATHRSPHAPTYADLRPRRPSDYFARWLPWVPVCVSVYACAILALLAYQVDHIRLSVDDSAWSVPTMLILGVFVATALVINGIGLTSIRWIAISPRTLLSSNTQAARGADNFRRATGIGSILQMTWMSSAYLLMAATSIVTTPGAPIDHTSPTSFMDVAPVLGAMGFNFLLIIPVLVGGSMIAAFQGRLGGTLTGWRNPLKQLDAVPFPQS